MILEETYEELPNGFHDAEIEELRFEPATEKLTLTLFIWVGTMDNPPELRERYRRGNLLFIGVDSFFLPEPRATPLNWIILNLERVTHQPRETRYPLQQAREAKLAKYEIGLGYAELTVLAEAFDFAWASDEVHNRHP